MYFKNWTQLLKEKPKFLLACIKHQECLWCNAFLVSSLFVACKIIHFHTGKWCCMSGYGHNKGDLEGMAKGWQLLMGKAESRVLLCKYSSKSKDIQLKPWTNKIQTILKTIQMIIKITSWQRFIPLKVLNKIKDLWIWQHTFCFLGYNFVNWLNLGSANVITLKFSLWGLEGQLDALCPGWLQ